MYLKRLDMLGFKSFAIRTQMEFSTGITAVVGPNGAGKSNVADAMRWVLGEQSMRQLRGKKSDDIIFVGGHGKPPLGMAEVSLTLDNSTGWVPSEYSEITVTRRSYRSGENEYLINKQKVRLKDVVLLLAQARIGHDSYTVVGQGLIDAALSLRAEERRGLFEDAAGIRPFQVQRADAENRLRSTEQNLDRLRDIVTEIEPRLAPLAEQARRAAEYTQLNGELQDVLLTWYALQWRRLRTAKERAEIIELEQAQHIRRLEQSIQSLDEETTTVRAKRQYAQVHISDLRAESAEAHNAVQKIEREIAVCEERITGLTRQQQEQQEEERRLRERLIAVQRQIIDQEEQCAIADEALDSEAAALASLEGHVAKAQKEYEMDERRLRGAQSDLIQVQARLGASQSDLGRQQKHLGERNRTLAARRDTIAQSQQTLRTLETRLVDERARLHTVRNEEQQVTQRKQSIARAISDAQQEMERLKTTVVEAERNRRTVSDRLNMLKNWRQSLSGYSDGIRTLLRAPAGKITGIIGPLPQLGVAPAGMESAMEAALGQFLQSVVVETIDDAYSCLRYLQSSAQGKALVLWLCNQHVESAAGKFTGNNNDESLQRFLAEHSISPEQVIGYAWQYIQCEDRYLSLFQRLLQDIIIVKNAETAQFLLSRIHTLPIATLSDLPFKTTVTMKGEVMHVDGWLVGGHSKEGSQQGQHGLLAHERELRELPQQLSTHVALIDQLNAMLSEVQRAQEGRRAEQNAIDKELQKLTTRINEVNKTVNTTQRDLERVQTELQLASSVEQQLTAEVLGLEQEVQAAQERVRAHEKSQREMEGLVEEFQREMEERALVFRRQQDELGRARTALAVKRQEAKALHQQLLTQQGQAQDIKGQIEQHIARVKESEQRYRQLEESITVYRAEHAQAQNRAYKLTEALRLAEEQVAAIDTHITALEKQNLSLRHSMTEVEGSYRRSLLESQKARDALETLLQQLEEEMGVTDPKALHRYAAQADVSTETPEHNDNGATPSEPDTLSEEEEAQLRRLRRRVDTLRSRIKSLGGYDPDAPRQYEETRTRFEFLSTQIADMEQAALHLRSIIGQLDVTMARQFETTFQAVNARFREHFTTLFNGGHARLELTTAKASEDDAVTTSTSSTMPTGVDVIVQPPGKKVQDLSLLSGGERALVSAALLFSLLEINPPPFCLLDEVDAALDESNVTRFCDILKRLAQRTQFIVITHNRVTMTSSQVIYGVSMGNDSVSRLLSMKLEESPAAGDR